MPFGISQNAAEQHLQWQMSEGRRLGASREPENQTLADLLDRLLWWERMVVQAEIDVAESDIAHGRAQSLLHASISGLFIGRKLLALDNAKDRLARSERCLAERCVIRDAAREAVEKMAQAQQPVAPPNNIG